MGNSFKAPRTQRQRTHGLTGDYPPDWPEISHQVKERAGWCCERCGHPHDVAAGYMLTVHHLDMNKANCADWNLAALCQRCHLRIQGRVDFYQQYMLEHSSWMQAHVDGFKSAVGIGGQVQTVTPILHLMPEMPDADYAAEGPVLPSA